MASFGDLPHELLLEILDHISVQDHFSHDEDAAIVCRAWREPAQCCMFRTVDITGDKRLRAFLASPAQSRYPTKHVVLWIDPSHEIGMDLVRACPKLVRLEFPAISTFDNAPWIKQFSLGMISTATHLVQGKRLRISLIGQHAQACRTSWSSTPETIPPTRPLCHAAYADLTSSSATNR